MFKKNPKRKTIMSIAYHLDSVAWLLSNSSIARYMLKAILNRGYFRKMRLFSFFLSPLASRRGRDPLLELRDVSTPKGIAQKGIRDIS